MGPNVDSFEAQKDIGALGKGKNKTKLVQKRNKLDVECSYNVVFNGKEDFLVLLPYLFFSAK